MAAATDDNEEIRNSEARLIGKSTCWEIKKTEEFIRKNIAGRKAKMARGRQKQLDRMDKMEALEQKEIIPHFHFPVLPLTNTEHLLVKHLAVGYFQ